MNFAQKVDLVRRCLRLIKHHLQERMFSSGLHRVKYEDLTIKWSPGWAWSGREEPGELTLYIGGRTDRFGEVVDGDEIFRVKVMAPTLKFHALDIQWADMKRAETILASLGTKMILDDLAGV